MHRGLRSLLIAAVLGCLAATLAAQAPPPAAAPAPAAGKQYVFPAKGQTPEQQKTDESACNSWATGETGFDPANPPVYQAPPPPPPPPKGSAARGAARGAAAGYVIGDIADDKGQEGAAVGAAAGAVAAKGKQAKGAQAQQQAAAANKKAFDDKVAAMSGEYNKARTACLEAKGYTVK